MNQQLTNKLKRRFNSQLMSYIIRKVGRNVNTVLVSNIFFVIILKNLFFSLCKTQKLCYKLQ